MTIITKDGSLAEVEGAEALHSLRHTASHIMAQAIKHLYGGADGKNVKLAIGPAIDTGFYYDIDMEKKITDEDLAEIEREMKNIVKQNLKLERSTLSRADALKKFSDEGETYKVELIEALPEDAEISLFTQGDFTDLCAGPHVQSTGKVKAFKLMSIAGAYWRGDEKNKMLQRIYGTAFENKDELKDYLHMLEEAARRDHRKLGKELDLFSLHDEGPGFPFFHPNGMIIRNELINYWREVHRRYGYHEIKTPIILNRKLWETSGHWDHYKENMYFTQIDEEDYAVKPMNCPGGMLVYNTHVHSYRDLPLRLGELGLVHRHEKSGVLHGLFRVRNFTQDDAHIFMTPAQVEPEIQKTIDLFDEVYKTFGLQYKAELSTRPENSMGDDATWELATDALRKALDNRGLEFVINEGDGAFYGPKIDIKVRDAIGRMWQCSTVQVDFNLPERFDITYRTAENTEERPYMLHRALFGSIERFLGILIEHYAGSLPLWLSPVQAVILPIADRHKDAAYELASKLGGAGGRVEVYEQNEPMRVKVAKAQAQKVPYMIVLGDKEIENGTISVRDRVEGDLGTWPVEKMADLLRDAVV